MAKKKYKKQKSNNNPPAQDSLSSKAQTVARNNLKIHSIFLFLVSALVYGNTLNNGFALDDTLVLLGNSFTQQGLSGLGDIWTKDMFVGAHGKEFDLTGGRYRPLSLTVFAIMHEFFGKSAFVGHLINVLFFASSCVLIYHVLLKIFHRFNEWIPLVTALIFAVHPIHTEVVANIKSLDEIMALFFLLLAMYKMFERDTKSVVLSSIFYLLALLSKENTITALGIIPLTFLMFRKETIANSLKFTIPYFIIGAIYLVLREMFSGGFSSGLVATNLMDNPYIGMSMPTKLATLFLIAGKYISLLFAPLSLSYDYSYDAIGWRNWGDPFVLLSFTGIIATTAYAIWHLIKVTKVEKEPSILVYGIWFYIMAYSIVSNFVFNIGTYMGERFLYMASLGFCLALAALLAKLLKVDLKSELKLQPKWLIPVLIITIPFAALSFDRNKDWKDNFTLYKADIDKVPNSARARLFIGIENLNQYYKSKDPKQLEEAINQITKATEIYPDFYHAYYNLGLAYQAKKDHKKALEVFQQVLNIQPNHINTHYYMGMSYGSGFNDTQKAIEYMERGIKYGFKGADRYLNLGVAYGIHGNLKKAVECFEKAIPDNPNNPSLYQNLGITHKKLGNEAKSQQYLQKAKELSASK